MVENAIIETYYEQRKNLHAVRIWVLPLLNFHLLTIGISKTTVLGARVNSESRHARTVRFQFLTTET